MEIIINGRFLTQKITGVQRYALQLIKEIDFLIEKGEIDKKKFQFKIFAPRNIIHNLELKHIPIRKIGILKGHLWEQLEFPFYLKNKILICLGNTAPLISLFLNKKIIVTIHDLGFKYFPENYRFLFRTFYSILIPIILKYAWAIITVSESEKKLILNRYPFVKNKIFAIPQGGFIENPITAIEIKERDYLLYVGSLAKKKNLINFLLAFELIVNKNIPLNAIVIAPEGKIFEKVDIKIKPEVKKRVKFINKIDDQELISYYKNAFCFVFPSFHEGAGIPPIEAMSCGCPVLCSDISVLKERCNNAAIYFNPYLPEDIAQKILLLFENPELKEKLIKKGYERAKIFKWENTARKTVKLLEKLIFKV
ncbi:MAG: glycosyltransferase family 4 protein [candidate division WOR-3 bacterium]|nr:glycosyltransferase family 4 protein [candidate division WOR-3 bacterium]MCX7837579.1 glycosyltransferase family 4 protein [candidate division WOR-3 bacterium]MDW8113478.1 glycosyltransferase family 1 protein [candidate division WOR-3 bacterium]